MGISMIAFLLFVLVAALPVRRYPWYARAEPYGYYPAGGAGLLLVIVLILVISGVVPHW